MKYKTLFIHNSTPEYRMEFWIKLKQYLDCDFLITNKILADKIYKFENRKESIDFIYWDSHTWSDIKKMIVNYNCVILPPQDSIKEMYVGHLVMNVCKKCGIKTVYWSEKWEADWRQQPVKKKIKSLLQRKIIGSIAKKCDCCIASGSKSYDYLSKIIGVSIDRIEVAFDSSTSPFSNSVDIRSKYSIQENKKIILYLGRIVSRKGCYDLINSVKHKLEELNAVLLICGDGEDMARCKQAAEDRDNIVFAGMVQPNERRNYYSQCDVFVIPSICENGIIEAWGLTVNEALECGTMVLASDVVGAAWDLINEKTGIMFHSTNELVEDIVALLKNPIDRELVKKEYLKFNVENMAHSFAYVIRRIDKHDT